MSAGNTIINNLWRHRWISFAIFTIVFCGSFARVITSPAMYQVKATIQVERKDFSIEKSDQPYEQTTAQVNNTIQKLKSASLLNKTLLKLNHPNYSPESREFMNLQKRFSIKYIPGSNVIEIGLVYNSALEGALMVNTLIETLIEENKLYRQEEVKQAITYIESALTEIRTRQSELAAPVKSKNVLSSSLFNKFELDLKNDLQNAERQLRSLKEPIPPAVRTKIDTVFTNSLAKYRPRLASLERKLVAELGPGGWNSPPVRTQLTAIWREKTNVAKALKEDLYLGLTAFETEILNNPEELCVYQVKLYDLQIRQLELRGRNPGQENQSVAYETQMETKSLQELEARLIKKRTELESFNELSSLEILWIDRAIPFSQPYFPPGLLLTAGLSLGLAFLALLILGLIFVEYRSLKEAAVNQGNS